MTSCLLHVEDGSLLISRVVLFSLIPFSIAFLFVFFVFYRQKRESDVRLKMALLEMDALRAQMNPHFLFNSLNSIHQYIQENDKVNASSYLVKFSNLIRKVLAHSRQQMVSLEEDLEVIRLYLELEMIRKPFELSIEVDDEIDETRVLVPPFIAQPFLENSIVHGFARGDHNWRLTLHIRKQGKELIYLTEDNGQNTQGLSIRAEGEPSFGTAITRGRLDAISRTHGKEFGFEQRDIINDRGEYAGKQTIIRLPFEIDQ